MQALYLGVDGGASKCIVRLEDASGHCIGQGTGGSANIRLSPEQTWHSIQHALSQAIAPLNISLPEAIPHIHAGLGLAGCEMQDALREFLHSAPHFKTLKVTSDAHIACLGAHSGQNGSIIIAGTGVVAYQVEQNSCTKVGGWGFPHDDLGGGAWLGLQALKLCLQWKDGRRASSRLAEAIDHHFNHDLSAMVHWANEANSTQFATLAPYVIRTAATGDEESIALLKQAAAFLDQLSDVLIQKQTNPYRPLPCALVGSIAMHLRPYLAPKTQTHLVDAAAPPESGAILFVRSET